MCGSASTCDESLEATGSWSSWISGGAPSQYEDAGATIRDFQDAGEFYQKKLEQLLPQEVSISIDTVASRLWLPQ